MATGFFILILAFAGMEMFSWAFHKYVMHGPLWGIHKTHHRKPHGFFELNDVFTLFFGSSATLLIIVGAKQSFAWQFWTGLGISLYGAVYFLLHDILIHKRLPLPGFKPINRYLKGIYLAHRDHHKSNNRSGAVSFGLLAVRSKYFKENH